MFTGIVAAVGRITGVETLGEGAGVRLTVESGTLGLGDVAIGDSIAIQGACMTAIEVDGTRFVVEVSRESLSKTVGLDAPGEVNLEKALRLADRLGGHLVSGHVDGLIPHTLQATTLKRLAPGARVNLEIDLIARYVERMLGEAGARPR
jgi:riboflavin synthase